MEMRGVLLATIRQAKEMLSTKEEHRLVLSTTKGPKSILVSRNRFDSSIINCVKLGANKASALVNTARECSYVPLFTLLVGGSCKVPLIHKEIEAATGIATRVWQYSREAVAYGAAIAAAKIITPHINSSGTRSQNPKANPAEDNGYWRWAPDYAEPMLTPRLDIPKYMTIEGIMFCRVGETEWKPASAFDCVVSFGTETQAAHPIKKTLDAKSKDFIAHKKQKHKDAFHVLEEVFLLNWRLENGANVTAHNLAAILETIRNDEERSSIAIKVKQGLNDINIPSFEEIVRSSTLRLASTFSDFVYNIPTQYIEIFPELSEFNNRFVISDSFNDDLIKELKNSLQTLSPIFESIRSHYTHLCEFHPRYDEIMNRSNWLNFLIGGAAGWFTGGLGFIAVAAWEQWKNMSDKEFMESYCATLQGFIDECIKFNSTGENLISKAIPKLNALWENAFYALEELYINIYEMDNDFAEVEQRINALARAKSHSARDYHEYCHLIISNLKQKPTSSARLIRSVIEGFRDDGALLTPTGELDEKALAALFDSQ